MLYVAMTRAKHCLALSSVLPSVSAPGSWWNRLEPLLADAQVLGVAGAAEVPGGDGDAVASGAHDHFTLAELPVLPAHLRAAPRAVAEGVDEGLDAADSGASLSTPSSRLGEAMHQLLEQAGVAGAPLADLRSQGWPAARVARLAQDFDITAGAARTAAQTAQRILAGEGAWAWDATMVDTTINEAPLRYQGQSLRIDRLVHCHQPPERAGWWVLDYKSAAEPERQPALMAQLQRYRAAVSGQVPGERVWAAFLTGDGRMVRVHGDAGPADEGALVAGTGQGAGSVRHTLAPAAQSTAAASTHAPPAAPGMDGAGGGPSQSAVQGSLF